MEESFSGTRISIAGTKVTIPLPTGYLADVQVSKEQARKYQDLVRRRLDAALSVEKCCNERLATGLPSLNPRDWKSTRSFDGLQLFQRRRRGRSRAELASEEDFHQAAGDVASGQPSVVAIGNILGSIDDVLYGIAGTTDEETRTTLSFLLRKTDAAVQRNLELAMTEDPFHYFGLKWLCAVRPLGAPRDVSCLQATGVEVDPCGKRYGHLLLHSVDVPECPPFDHKQSNIVRGKVFLACIFCETTPGFVDVLTRGIFDMSGERELSPKLLTSRTTSACIGALRKLVDCADAKKLTLLARRTASRVPLEETAAQLPPPPKKAFCVVCIKCDGSGLFSGARLRSCRVCGMPVCSKCQVRDKRVFLGRGRQWSLVPCCPMRALKAHRMTDLRPSEPAFAVEADYFVKKSPTAHPVVATARSSFGLQLAEQVAACAESSDKKERADGVVACPNAA